MSSKPVYIPDTTHQICAVNQPDTQSKLCVPIKVGSRIYGIIDLESNRRDAYGEASRRLVMTMASQLASAINRLRSKVMERQQASRLARSNALIDALSKVATRIDATRDPDKVLEVMGAELDGLGFSTLVALIEPDKETMKFRYTSLPVSSVRLFERAGSQKMQNFRFSAKQFHPPDQPFGGTHLFDLRQGAEILNQVLPGLNSQRVERIMKRIDHLERNSIAHLPLKVEGGFRGVLWLIGADLLQSDLSAFSIFASQAATSLENARLYAAERKRSQELESLRQVSLSLTSSLELPSVLDTILTRTINLMDAQNGVIFFFDGEQLSYAAARWANGKSEITPTPRSNGITYLVAKTGERITIQDINSHPMYQDWQWGGAIVSQPLLVGKQVRGVMNLAFGQPHLFDEGELQTLQLLADQASLAMENARLFEETQRLASTDGLTGLNTRRNFFKLAEAEFSRCVRFQRPLTAVMIDVDHFKQVNDTYGHLVGDEVLREIGNRLKISSRSIDIVGRYGGEEFAVLLLETDLPTAESTVQRLHECVAGQPFHTDRGELKVTISMGAADLSEDTPDLNALIKQADDALLEAKENGRNQVVHYAEKV